MKGIILAGGLGTRLRPLSYTGPKQLVPIANKPVLHYIIEDLKDAGVTDIGVIVGYTPERINAIKESLGTGERWGVNITYIEQDAPRGLAHAVGIAKEFIGDQDFVVYLGDNIIRPGIRRIVEEFKHNGSHASLLLAESETPQKFGTAIIEGSKIVDVEEKPANPRSNLVITGVYLFKPIIFDMIKNVKPGKNGELQITDAIKMLVHSPEHKVGFQLIEDWWDDTGTAESVLRANHLILSEMKHKIEGNVHNSCKMLGNVQVGSGTIIKEDCVLRGPIKIGKNCLIGPNAYIGPYTSIGDSVVITNGDIDSSVILSNTHIDFNDKIIDSLIGEDVKIISKETLPKGYKLLLGKSSEVRL